MSNQTTPPRRILTWTDWEAALKNNSYTEAEKQLVEACVEGRQCRLGNGTRPTKRSPENEIGSDLLRYLIKGGCGTSDLNDWGLDLVGAYITGEVDLRLVKATGATAMLNCHFAEPIYAMDARFYRLNLKGSSCFKLNAQGVDVKGNIFLRDGFAAKGEVSLSGAVIGGQLDCSGGSFENAKGNALNAQGVDVKGDIFFSDGFAAKGEVSLSGAVIGGQLDCSGGSFEHAEGDALNAQGVDVKGYIFLSDGFAAKGEVSLSGAVIGGQLDCSGGSFEHAEGDALNAQDVNVRADIFLSGGFAAKGEVLLSGAVIGGQLNCSGGSFEREKGNALTAQGVDVKGDIFLRDGFAAKGEVSISGAVIGGQLDCSSGSFEHAEGDALNALNCEINSLIWRDVKRFVGNINLAGMQTLDLTDDVASWVLVDHAYLDGLVYQTIHGPLDTKMRLEWLGRARAYDGSFSPQPYEQLAWTLKRMGHSEQRRAILIEKEKRQRSYERRNLRFRRRFARLVSRFNAKPNKTNEKALEKYRNEAEGVNNEFASHLAERLVLFHDNWPQNAANEGVPSSEIARAQAGFREELFWHNGRIRVRIAWMHIKDHMARYLVGYGYRPFNFVWALALLIGVGWGGGASGL